MTQISRIINAVTFRHVHNEERCGIILMGMALICIALYTSPYLYNQMVPNVVRFSSERTVPQI